MQARSFGNPIEEHAHSNNGRRNIEIRCIMFTSRRTLIIMSQCAVFLEDGASFEMSDFFAMLVALVGLLSFSMKKSRIDLSASVGNVVTIECHLTTFVSQCT